MNVEAASRRAAAGVRVDSPAGCGGPSWRSELRYQTIRGTDGGTEAVFQGPAGLPTEPAALHGGVQGSGSPQLDVERATVGLSRTEPMPCMDPLCPPPPGEQTGSVS